MELLSLSLAAICMLALAIVLPGNAKSDFLNLKNGLNSNDYAGEWLTVNQPLDYASQ